MKRKLSLLLALAMLLALAGGCSNGSGGSSQSPEGGETLIVAMELAYPPFETKNDAGEPMGVSVDIARAFGEYLGREVVIENMAWGGLITSLQSGKADMVISSMTITEDRKKEVDFSDPYANAILALLVNRDSGVASAEDLNVSGMKIAVKLGSTGHSYATKNLPNAEAVVFEDESACVMEVVQGRADAFIYDQLTIYRNWQANPDTTNAVFIPFQDPDQWGAAFPKDSDLVAEFNAFLKDFADKGGFDDVTSSHLAKEKTAFDELGFLWFFNVG